MVKEEADRLDEVGQKQRQREHMQELERQLYEKDQGAA